MGISIASTASIHSGKKGRNQKKRDFSMAKKCVFLCPEEWIPCFVRNHLEKVKRRPRIECSHARSPPSSSFYRNEFAMNLSPSVVPSVFGHFKWKNARRLNFSGPSVTQLKLSGPYRGPRGERENTYYRSSVGSVFKGEPILLSDLKFKKSSRSPPSNPRNTEKKVVVW